MSHQTTSSNLPSHDIADSNDQVDPRHLDEPRKEYVAMAQTSFARIVAIAEEIAWDHPLGSGPGELDVHEEVGRLVHALWNRLAHADGLLAQAERLTLERIVAGHPAYASVVFRLAELEASSLAENRLVLAASERPVARQQLIIELETFGYALASVDSGFDHSELDVLHAFLGEVRSLGSVEPSNS